MWRAAAFAIASSYALGVYLDGGLDEFFRFCADAGVQCIKADILEQHSRENIMRVRGRFVEFFEKFDAALSGGPMPNPPPKMLSDATNFRIGLAILEQAHDAASLVDVLAAKSVKVSVAVAQCFFKPDPLPAPWLRGDFENIVPVVSAEWVAYSISATRMVGVALADCHPCGDYIRMPCCTMAIELSGRELRPQPIRPEPGPGTCGATWLIPRERVLMLKGVASFVPMPGDRKLFLMTSK